MAGKKTELSPPFSRIGKYGWAIKGLGGGNSREDSLRSKLRVFENGNPLFMAHQSIQLICDLGGGRYSHWKDKLFFSTTDNTDPNVNGRTYHVEFDLDVAMWQEAVMMHLGKKLWGMHPSAEYFVSRGGSSLPPPMFCNLGLTNICNLRCEICGSQKFLDETGTRRRHMPTDKFRAVADVLFPFMYEVELNSQGEPLLHPDIALVLETIAKHKCELKLQTNGTLFTDEIIELLLNSHGTINLSLDAVESRFDEVRHGGKWAQMEPKLLKFLKVRRPERLTVGVYPTITRRTLNDVISILDWSEENRVDVVAFHKYIRVQNSFEEEPGVEELSIARDAIRQWAEKRNRRVEVTFDGELISDQIHKSDNANKIFNLISAIGRRFSAYADKKVRAHTRQQTLRTEHACPEKRAAFLSFARRFYFVPMEEDVSSADPRILCTAPYHYVEIGLEGQISACCRSQGVTLGHATSIELFADAWFGRNYDLIRSSLRRDSVDPYPLPNCEECISNFAPKAGRGRKAFLYGERALSEEIIPYTHIVKLEPGETVLIEGIQKEQGHCYIARLPPGINPERYELWEAESKLPVPNTMHDEIRTRGLGCYSIWGRSLYFSSSDNTDPRRNGRQYILKKMGI